MKTIVPSYYSSFACLMGACRHSCCIGWEIDIDPDTLAYYRGLPGEIGQKLNRCIDENSETACFHLTENERCPFLTVQGLCELILSLGENSLCHICADHPRFRNFFSDHVEMGLGLCCEAAARLILGHEGKVSLIEIEVPESKDCEAFTDALPEDEQAILSLRDRLTTIIQNRSLPINDRITQLLQDCALPQPSLDYAAWVDLLLKLERLDETWTTLLKALLASAEEEMDESCLDTYAWDTAFEQLMVYLLYRHLSAAPDIESVECEILYCVIIWKLLRRMLLINYSEENFHNMEPFFELCRLYSSEIEYSDENLIAIHDAL